MKGIFGSLFSSNTRVGIFVSDMSLRYAVIRRNEKGFELSSFGAVPLDGGIFSKGHILDAARLTQALAVLKKQAQVSRAHIAVAVDDFTESPLVEWESCFQKAGIEPVSLETEADAASRAVVHAGDAAAHVIVDAGGIGKDVTRAAGEIDRHLVRRYAHAGRAPESIILVGEGAGTPGLAERLSAILRTKVVPGNVWTNLLLPASGIAKLTRSESYAYAGAIGAALKY